MPGLLLVKGALALPVRRSRQSSWKLVSDNIQCGISRKFCSYSRNALLSYFSCIGSGRRWPGSLASPLDQPTHPSCNVLNSRRGEKTWGKGKKERLDWKTGGKRERRLWMWEKKREKSFEGGGEGRRETVEGEEEKEEKRMLLFFLTTLHKQMKRWQLRASNVTKCRYVYRKYSSIIIST